MIEFVELETFNREVIIAGNKMAKDKNIWFVNDMESGDVLLFAKKEQAVDYANSKYDIGGENSYYDCHYIENPMDDSKDLYEIAPAIFEDGERYPHNDDPNDTIAIVGEVTIPSATRKQWWIYQDNLHNGNPELFATKDEVIRHAYAMRTENAKHYEHKIKFHRTTGKIIGYLPDEDGNYATRDSREVAWITKTTIK